MYPYNKINAYTIGLDCVMGRREYVLAQHPTVETYWSRSYYWCFTVFRSSGCLHYLPYCMVKLEIVRRTDCWVLDPCIQSLSTNSQSCCFFFSIIMADPILSDLFAAAENIVTINLPPPPPWLHVQNMIFFAIQVRVTLNCLKLFSLIKTRHVVMVWWALVARFVWNWGVRSRRMVRGKSLQSMMRRADLLLVSIGTPIQHSHILLC